MAADGQKLSMSRCYGRLPVFVFHQGQPLHQRLLLASSTPRQWQKQAAERVATALRLLFRRSPRFGIRLRCCGRDAFVPLPLNKAWLSEWLLPDGIPEGAEAGFVLQGEEAFGMPLTPLAMLSQYHGRSCAGYEFEFWTLVPLDVTAAPLVAQPAEPAATPLELPLQLEMLRVESAAIGSSLLKAFCRQGFAVISVDGRTAASARDALEALLHLHSRLSREERRTWFRRFNDGRYVGFASDQGRDFLQLRRGADEFSKLPCPEKARNLLSTLMLYFHQAEHLAAQLLEALLLALGLEDISVASLLEDEENDFGASVLRCFVYRDKSIQTNGAWSAACPVHADMGLLTLAPRSTAAALELLWPGGTTSNSAVLLPEEGLGANDWVVFPGETLSFLSGGTVQAPLHRVPWVAREPGEPPRRSLPFFLRAAPSAQLRPCGGQEVVLTCRQFMERHALALRPWRNFQQSQSDW